MWRRVRGSHQGSPDEAGPLCRSDFQRDMEGAPTQSPAWNPREGKVALPEKREKSGHFVL